MNIYLDIDGVLLANELHAANYAHEFLEFVTSRYPTYWLTTHCKGNASTAVEYLRDVFGPKTVQLLQCIRQTNWTTAKTEAIDFTQPFLWFDDDLFYEERQVLARHNALDSWIQVDLRSDVNQLAKFVSSFPIPVAAL